jgi:glutathione S-transferase
MSCGAMWQLYQFPLCPFSRKIRLLLSEKGVVHELVRESPWLKRDEFSISTRPGRRRFSSKRRRATC